jgi:hypothetical protein
MSSSRVKHLPPAAVILARAVSVKRRAATLTLGMSRSLISSVTVATITTVLSVLSPRCLTSLERERGGRLVLEEMSLLRTVLVKAESVLRVKNLNNYTQNMVSTPKIYLPSRGGCGKDSCSSSFACSYS